MVEVTLHHGPDPDQIVSAYLADYVYHHIRVWIEAFSKSACIEFPGFSVQGKWPSLGLLLNKVEKIGMGIRRRDV